MLLFAFVFVIGAVGCAPKQAAGPVTIHVLTMDQAGLKPVNGEKSGRHPFLMKLLIIWQLQLRIWLCRLIQS